MDFEYSEGDRIAQLIIEKCHDVEWEEVAYPEDLTSSERGEDGFGSTGE
jgi:dUTP pyrophosphatase